MVKKGVCIWYEVHWVLIYLPFINSWTLAVLACRISKAITVLLTDKPSEATPSTEKYGHQGATRHSGLQRTQQNLLYEIKGELQLLRVAGGLWNFYFGNINVVYLSLSTQNSLSDRYACDSLGRAAAGGNVQHWDHPALSRPSWLPGKVFPSPRGRDSNSVRVIGVKQNPGPYRCSQSSRKYIYSC